MQEVKPEWMSKYEFEVYKKTSEGISTKDIAEALNKSEGSIRKTRVIVRKKIEKELYKAARTLRLDLDLSKIPKDSGLLIGFDWIHNTKVYLIFTISKGILAWWEHECKTEECLKRNQETLELICREKGVELSPEERSLSQLEQFRIVMKKIQEKK
ncbi:MAG: hypothetical protein ACTSR2_06855 [Candidatus Hodarchaeales archaeon]